MASYCNEAIAGVGIAKIDILHTVLQLVCLRCSPLIGYNFSSETFPEWKTIKQPLCDLSVLPVLFFFSFVHIRL